MKSCPITERGAYGTEETLCGRAHITIQLENDLFVQIATVLDIILVETLIVHFKSKAFPIPNAERSRFVL